MVTNFQILDIADNYMRNRVFNGKRALILICRIVFFNVILIPFFFFPFCFEDAMNTLSFFPFRVFRAVVWKADFVLCVWAVVDMLWIKLFLEFPENDSRACSPGILIKLFLSLCLSFLKDDWQLCWLAGKRNTIC